MTNQSQRYQWAQRLIRAMRQEEEEEEEEEEEFTKNFTELNCF